MASNTEKLLITFLPIAKKMLANSAARSWLPREFLDYSRAKIGKTLGSLFSESETHEVGVATCV